MPAEPRFTNNEMAQLHLFLCQDVANGRLEVRRTVDRPYREYLKRRMVQEMALLEKMEKALPVLRMGSEGRWITGMSFTYLNPGPSLQEATQ